MAGRILVAALFLRSALGSLAMGHDEVLGAVHFPVSCSPAGRQMLVVQAQH
jgi:hypothetical protein